MGISFKVSKTGKRFQPKPLLSSSVSGAGDEEEAEDAVISVSKKKTDSATFSDGKLLMQGDVNENKATAELIDTEVSFTLSLFPDGYSIAKPMENESASQTPTVLPKSLLPYDRASETLFSAIESGRLPADILDDIPGKYIDGTLFCEVQDYRKCFFEGLNVASGNNLPIINRVSLRMSLENIVKDIPAILDDDWTYGDMMEVESRILKALQPKLCLNPTPQLDRLSHNPVPTMLSLGIRSMRRKRQMQILEVAVSSNNVHGKKIYVDRVPESSRGDSGPLTQQPSYENLNTQGHVSNSMLPIRNNSFGLDSSPIASPLVSHQSRYQIGSGSHKMMRDQRSGSLSNISVASPGGQDMMIPFTDNNAASILDKRDTQDGQPSPLSNKKARLVHTGCDGNLQNLGPQVDNLQGSELHWKNTLMQQQQIGRGIQYTNNGMQKFSQQFEGGPSQEGGPAPFTIGQQGIRYKVKEELVETERLEKTELGRMNMGDSEINIIDAQQSRLQQRMPHQFMRSSFPQTQWNNLGQPFDNNSRKEDSVQKRKLVQSPRVNAGGLPQSPLSSKSGEISSGSMGPHFGSAVTSGLVQAQKEKSAVTSFPSVGVGITGNPSFTTSANDSIQRQNLTQASGKRRSNSLPKTPMISGVGSPASVSNISMPINVSSPPVGTQPPGDQAMVERFSKIEIVSMRYQINFRKKKMDEYPIRKPNLSTQQLASIFSNDSIDENLSDETCKMPLSKSLIGGNVNVCKTRILNFTQTERIIQGNGFQIVPKARTRMILSEKPNDGSVAIHIGDIEDAQYLAAEDYLPTLPNTYAADLLAAQFCSLMVHEGYHVEDHVQPRPVRMNPMPVGQLDGLGIPPSSGTSELHQLSEGVSIQAPNDNVKPSTSGLTPVSSSQNVQVPRMLHPGHPQAIQMSQGLLPGAGVSISSRPQQPEQLPPIHQQPQQQQQQFQRSTMMLPANSMQHLSNMSQNANMQLGSHMTTKPSALQLQMLQQHQPQLLQAQQQQQQSAMQRKMMTGLGTVGMGNIGSNIVGLGGLGNVMGIGGARGVGGTGISAPMGSISSMGNMNQNPMSLTSASSLSNAIRAGTLTAAQANYMKMRMAAHSRNMLGNSQSSIGGISGARQMLPGSASLSMLGPALNRTNMNQLQRASIGQMGPPKIMPGMNLYMNQQQQLQQHQQQQQQLQQQLHMQQQQQIHMQQQQQHLQQAQEASSPLPAVVSSPQVGSPSCIGVPHQMNQTQQQQQQSQPQQQASPQQMSQRTPMSPQLSSGVVNPMTASNAEACPASPQLSSQTLGSVGTMSNSPMELQGVNKSNSLNNLQGS